MKHNNEPFLIIISSCPAMKQLYTCSVIGSAVLGFISMFTLTYLNDERLALIKCRQSAWLAYIEIRLNGTKDENQSIAKAAEAEFEYIETKISFYENGAQFVAATFYLGFGVIGFNLIHKQLDSMRLLLEEVITGHW